MVFKSITYIKLTATALLLGLFGLTSNNASAQTALRLPAFPVYQTLTPAAVKGDEIARAISKPRSGKVEDWKAFVAEIQILVSNGALDAPAQSVAMFDQVNRFWNRRVFFSTDARHYSMEDVWTTPFETLSEGSGDCEDFAIAKYFTLLEAGVPESALALSLGFYQPTGEAHITLTVTLGNGEQLVLDNLVTAVKTVQERRDLNAVLTMNRQTLTVYQLNYLQAGDDLAGRFSAMNKRYLQQSVEWNAILTAAANSSAHNAAQDTITQ